MDLEISEELLLLFEKNADKLIEQTRTRPQETLEFELNKSQESFS